MENMRFRRLIEGVYGEVRTGQTIKFDRCRTKHRLSDTYHAYHTYHKPYKPGKNYLGLEGGTKTKIISAVDGIVSHFCQ